MICWGLDSGVFLAALFVFWGFFYGVVVTKTGSYSRQRSYERSLH